jgi:hypothetical protein
MNDIGASVRTNDAPKYVDQIAAEESAVFAYPFAARDRFLSKHAHRVLPYLAFPKPVRSKVDDCSN